MTGEGGGGRHPFLDELATAWLPHAHVRGPVVVAVSGGGDSVGLLRGLFDMLLSRGESPARRLVVAHARHDLRDEIEGDPAGGDAAFVQQLARDLELPCVVKPLAVRQAVSGGEGLEAAARRLRYDFLRDTAGECGARLVATAHTVDDQVETILHRLLRGTGLEGLCGMPQARELVEGIAVVRPMLAIPAATVRGYLRDVGQIWREDASNADTRHARNLLRHEILPRLEEGAYPGVREAILRLSRQAATAAAGSAAVVEAVLDELVSDAGGGRVRVRAESLAGRPRDFLASVAAGLWRRTGWPRRDMAARHYEAVGDLLAVAAAHHQAAHPETAHPEGQQPDSRVREVLRSGCALDLPGGLRATVEPGGVLHVGPVDVSPRPGPWCRR